MRCSRQRKPAWKCFRWLRAAVLTVFSASGCSDASPTELKGPGPAASDHVIEPEPAIVRELAAARGIGRMPPPPYVRRSLVELGRALAFDPVLSGNRDIACMTCHIPALATGDGRHLAIGQGGTGLGPARLHPEGRFIARNAPPLFNLHVLDAFFWDGRVFVDARGSIHTPAGAQLSANMRRVFEFGALSAVGLFPVLSREEMRGFSGNELAAIPDDQYQRIWRALMHRLGEIAEYRQLFEAAYSGVPFTAMNFAHASNAIAGFLLSELASCDSPWDQFLDGDDRALDREQLHGARTFLELRCSICHNGPALTDGEFHNVALAQFGPGLGDGPLHHDDFGHQRVSGDRAHRYAFRTTPLRNVELTGPYGHAGQFVQLRDFIDHYSESHQKLLDYDVSQIEPLLRNTLVDNKAAILATRDPILEGVVFDESILRSLSAYMSALTEPAARNLAHLIPARVPSGLPVSVHDSDPHALELLQR